MFNRKTVLNALSNIHKVKNDQKPIQGREAILATVSIAIAAKAPP